MNSIRVNIPALITFFDESHEVRRHSNAIKTLAGEELGVCLLLEHFRRLGWTPSALLQPCTSGNREGYRLDKWVKASVQGIETHFQVEVKTWSHHGFGKLEKPLRLNCSAEELAQYKKAGWQGYWRDGQFIDSKTNNKLNKVLTRMKPPLGASKVEALACLWVAVHPDGKPEPLFHCDTTGSDFSRVWIFSMSSFLRGIVEKEKTLDLDMPLT